MRIVILGAGQVGSSVAHHLSGEGSNEITLVDLRENLLRKLQDLLDIRTVRGNAALPSVLQSAGVDQADMLIALTSSDEVNFLACEVANALFRVPIKVARIRSAAYLNHPHLFAPEALAVDVLINPEQLVTDYILRVIENVGASQVVDFADGLVRLVAVRAYRGGPLVGQRLRTLSEHMPGIETRVAAIFRHQRPILPEGDTVVEPGDEVFFIIARQHIQAMMGELRRLERPLKRIIVAGGGNIGTRLTQALAGDYQVKVIEKDRERARTAAERMPRTLVLTGDAGDEELLREENIEHTDLFCAVTNDDEANILSSMLARTLGARLVLALVNRPAYVGLVEEGRIDIAVSPQQATISGLLAHIRRGNVVKVHSLRHGTAEAIEAVVPTDRPNPRLVGRRVEQIPLPRGASITALVRGERLLAAHHDSRVEAGDHVILFLTDRRRIQEVERLFQSGVKPT
ncbi:MAG: Trk system potassium transporter TrkA [Candidatus Competibacteraceae bacterium]|nr:Trk system potassium transporter TrkA [Candidatus Competibacteraceae bacterium]